MNEYKRAKEDVILVPELYEATVEAFYKVVEFLDESFRHVAIFSHNPGVTQFASRPHSGSRIMRVARTGLAGW